MFTASVQFLTILHCYWTTGGPNLAGADRLDARILHLCRVKNFPSWETLSAFGMYIANRANNRPHPRAQPPPSRLPARTWPARSQCRSHRDRNSQVVSSTKKKKPLFQTCPSILCFPSEHRPLYRQLFGKVGIPFPRCFRRINCTAPTGHELVGEFLQTRRCKPVVLAIEVGGRWSQETTTFLRLLAQAKARTIPARLKASFTNALIHRWPGQITHSYDR